MTSMDALATYAELGVATVLEAAGGVGLVDIPLLPLLPGRSVAGRALTVACGQDDNLAVHACIEYIDPGTVVVIAMPEPRPVALVGELLVTQMKNRGAAAILIDAAVRDWHDLQALGLPLWTRYIRARGASKMGPVRLRADLNVGGARITDGDVVVLDDDGAVVVPTRQAERVLEAGQQRLLRESEFRTRLQRGEMSIDIHNLRRQVELAVNEPT